VVFRAGAILPAVAAVLPAVVMLKAVPSKKNLWTTTAQGYTRAQYAKNPCGSIGMCYAVKFATGNLCTESAS
jgi:hypothetical protein